MFIDLARRGLLIAYKLKELEHANERLQDEVSKRNTNIEKLQSQIQQMQKQHDTQIHNLKEMHRQELDMKEKELSRLARIIDKAFRVQVLNLERII